MDVQIFYYMDVQIFSDLLLDKFGLKDKAKILSNDLRLAEEYLITLLSGGDMDTVANKNHAIAPEPKSPNSQKLRRIFKNIDICKD